MYAADRGRCGPCYGVLSVLLSPLIAFLIVLLLPPVEAAAEERRLAAGRSKKCPYCAELVKAEAVVCRYCGRPLAGGPRGETAITAQAIEQLLARTKRTQ